MSSSPAADTGNAKNDESITDKIIKINKIFGMVFKFFIKNPPKNKFNNIYVTQILNIIYNKKIIFYKKVKKVEKFSQIFVIKIVQYYL